MRVIVALALVLAVATAQQQQGALQPTQGGADAPPPATWTYTQGGSDWTGTCSSGTQQSPINIDTKTAVCVRHGEDNAKQYRIDYHYIPVANLTLQHSGNALKVKGDLGYVTIGGCNSCDGQEYYVKQLKFHAPSEHTFDTTPTQDGHKKMELHIIHQKKGSTGLNDLLVVAVLFYIQPEGGFPNSFLDTVNWPNAPKTPLTGVTINTPVNLHKLREAFRGEHYYYKGSLTAPPCTENVQWFVMKHPLGVTQQQFDTINSLFGGNSAFANGQGNSRVVQPLNNRQVIWYRRKW